MRLSKISWFVCGKQINYLPKLKPEVNNWSARHWQIMIFCNKLSSIIVLSFSHQVCFFNEYPREAKQFAIFMQEWSQEGEKHGFLYPCAEYYLQPNTVGRHCTWVSRGGLSANEKKEKFASHDNNNYCRPSEIPCDTTFIPSIVITSVCAKMAGIVNLKGLLNITLTTKIMLHDHNILLPSVFQ